MSLESERLRRIETLLIEQRDLLKVAVELMHESLDRPPPKAHIVVDISAWGITQLRRLAAVIVEAANNVESRK